MEIASLEIASWTRQYLYDIIVSTAAPIDFSTTTIPVLKSLSQRGSSSGEAEEAGKSGQSAQARRAKLESLSTKISNLTDKDFVAKLKTAATAYKQRLAKGKR